MGHTLTYVLVYFIIFAAVLVSALLVFAGTLLTAKLTRSRLFVATALVLAGYIGIYALQVNNWIAITGVVLIVAVFTGTCIGRTVNSESALVALCTAAAVADFVSFTFGITHAILSGYASGSSRLLLYLSFSVPIRSQVVPLAGIGDLIIIGAIFLSLRKAGYTLTETFLVPVSGLMIALIVGLLANGIFALPFIAGSVIGYILVKRRIKTPETCKSSS